jgi:hypothetical protein
MSFLSLALTEEITYWAPLTPDQFGKVAVAAPITIKCKWEDVQELFINAQGEEVRSSAMVYVDRDVVEQGWLFRGISTATEPRTVLGAKEIRGFNNIGLPVTDDAERAAML